MVKVGFLSLSNMLVLILIFFFFYRFFAALGHSDEGRRRRGATAALGRGAGPRRRGAEATLGGGSARPRRRRSCSSPPRHGAGRRRRWARSRWCDRWKKPTRGAGGNGSSGRARAWRSPARCATSASDKGAGAAGVLGHGSLRARSGTGGSDQREVRRHRRPVARKVEQAARGTALRPWWLEPAGGLVERRRRSGAAATWTSCGGLARRGWPGRLSRLCFVFLNGLLGAGVG
ncbi:hypothetical protein PVAP13_2NG282300 [Panicum virgatum]|uniref:Uncharacterized protein n=1 Tax=Panicum virgatum TaxID=38727 RepID=A0A8T0VL24_PANVG|nr:hypothetical protein PVAP13_2NG282300 [Panicum virgatum]